MKRRFEPLEAMAGPLPKAPGWTNYVNGFQTEAELAAIRTSIERGGPFGEEVWQQKMAKALG